MLRICLPGLIAHAPVIPAPRIFEGLCGNMRDYSRVVKSDGEVVYQKTSNTDGPVSIDGSLTMGGKDKGKIKELRLTCDRLVEEYEDELTELIMMPEGAGLPKLKKNLCYKLSGHCKGKKKKKTPPPPPAESSEDSPATPEAEGGAAAGGDAREEL